MLTAARLVGVPKPSGGLRPIAVGDTFRRLAAKCSLKYVQDTTKECLSPEQVGVAVSNAAESVARHVRLWLQQASAGHVVLQVDIKTPLVRSSAT